MHYVIYCTEGKTILEKVLYSHNLIWFTQLYAVLRSGALLLDQSDPGPWGDAVVVAATGLQPLRPAGPPPGSAADRGRGGG